LTLKLHDLTKKQEIAKFPILEFRTNRNQERAVRVANKKAENGDRDEQDRQIANPHLSLKVESP
jgi:hypothetical protein